MSSPFSGLPFPHGMHYIKMHTSTSIHKFRGTAEKREKSPEKHTGFTSPNFQCKIEKLKKWQKVCALENQIKNQIKSSQVKSQINSKTILISTSEIEHKTNKMLVINR